MGVVERWRKTRAERRKKELALEKDLKEAKAARQAADRVLKRHATSSAVAAKKAIAYAQAYEGTVEDPGRPNRGTQVDKWERLVEMIAQPWCGAFMYAVLRHAGVKGLSTRMRYVPYILADAKAGSNGMDKVVPLSAALPGDLLIFNWDGGEPDHVGMYLGRDKNGGILTIEGNTTSGSAGNQSNGGGVWNRTRLPANVQAVVRPRYPA